jgi:hypothetical protein
MHPRHVVDRAVALSSEGLNASEIARRIEVPRSTVRPWIAGHIPGFGSDGKPNRQGGYQLEPKNLPPLYVYLLGLYLGDGCLSEHARGVFKLRVILDLKYPGIIDECEAAIGHVRPSSRVGRRPYPDAACVEVFSYWKQWPLLFPQHGRGRKHHRVIALEPWQDALVARWPELLLRGLIHSDGCRFMNTGRGGWRHPRYSFSNRSIDIRGIFCIACQRLGLRWTSTPYTIYVSRVADVARLDEFVGPKA